MGAVLGDVGFKKWIFAKLGGMWLHSGARIANGSFVPWLGSCWLSFLNRGIKRFPTAISREFGIDLVMNFKQSITMSKFKKVKSK